MNFSPRHYKNGRIVKSQLPIQSVMKGGIIAGDIDLEKPSASNVFKRQETNSKLQSIGSTISKMNEKMKEKQNLVF